MNRKTLLFFYGIAMMAVTLLSQTIMRWFQYFYSPPVGNIDGMAVLIGIGLVGIPMSVARIIEAALNPIVSAWSDKCTSKFGKRMPFLMFGFPPSLLCFLLVWFPPSPSESIYNFIWLMGVLLVMFISFSLVYAPYLSLLGELTNDSDEVMFASAIQASATFIGAIISSAFASFLIKQIGFSGMGLVMGLIIFASFMPMLLFVREKRAEPQKNLLGVIKSLRLCANNKSFVFFMLLQMGIWFCLNTVGITLPYISELMMSLPKEWAGYLMSISYIAAFVMTPFVKKLVVKFSKTQIITASSVIFSVLMCLMAVWGVLLPFGVVIALLVVLGLVLCINSTYTNPIIVDIAIQETAKTGDARDAIFFGTYSMLISIIMAINSALMPFLFMVFGSNKQSFGGIQASVILSGILLALCTIMYRRSFAKS